MVEIEFLGPIKIENLKLEAANLSEVKEKLSEYAQLKEWLRRRRKRRDRELS